MLIKRLVWAVGVVVLDVFLQHRREVAWSGDEEVVEAFPAHGRDPALCDGVGTRCPDRGAEVWVPETRLRQLTCCLAADWPQFIQSQHERLVRKRLDQTLMALAGRPWK